MSKIYGYCRVSTPHQVIDRQVANIQAEYPGAKIIKEVYTGTKIQGRKELDKLLKAVEPGDTIVFDEVSRMSRSADEGYALYEDLYNQDINLIFLKEPHINTDVYRSAAQTTLPATGTAVDYILDGINRYMLAVAREQIKLAFARAEKEVLFLRQRTSEGMKAAKAKDKDKQIGKSEGDTWETRKAVKAKKIIRQHHKLFDGKCNSKETGMLCGITQSTLRKYIAEMLEEDKANEQS